MNTDSTMGEWEALFHTDKPFEFHREHHGNTGFRSPRHDHRITEIKMTVRQGDLNLLKSVVEADENRFRDVILKGDIIEDLIDTIPPYWNSDDIGSLRVRYDEKIEMWRYLVKQVPNVMMIAQSAGFLKACEHGAHHIVDHLIHAGVNARMNGDIALRKACKNAHFETVKLLVEAGCDVKNPNGFDAFCDVVRECVVQSYRKDGAYHKEPFAIELVYLFIEKGVDYHALDDWAFNQFKEHPKVRGRWEGREEALRYANEYVKRLCDDHLKKTRR